MTLRAWSPALSLVLAAVVLAACGGGGSAAGATGGVAGARKTVASSRDWTRFGWDARRSNDDPQATGITASNLRLLRRQQVRLPGTVDSSAIFLHDVVVRGRQHNAFFVTTTYGISLAIDAANGQILWRWTPAGYAQWAGSAQITTATPVA